MISGIVYQQVAISDDRFQATADSDANSNFNSHFFERSDSDSSFSQITDLIPIPPHFDNLDSDSNFSKKWE